jgi:hypothetical protein
MKNEFLSITGYWVQATGFFDWELFFGIDLIVESNLLSKGKLVFRFPACSFTHLAAGGRALLAEMAIGARMLLGSLSAARIEEKALIHRQALKFLFRVGHRSPQKSISWKIILSLSYSHAGGNSLGMVNWLRRH